MASITIKTNLPEVLTSLGESLKTILNPQYLLRPVATEVIPMMTERIHQKGQGSDGTEIGSYSNGYLKKREQSGRGKSTKVIVSFTRQLENSWSVLETPNGYGIGFTNPFNAQKLRWVEEAKDKEIGNLSTAEIDYAFERVNELVANALNK
jgi:hypothetical protein